MSTPEKFKTPSNVVPFRAPGDIPGPRAFGERAVAQASIAFERRLQKYYLSASSLRLSENELQRLRVESYLGYLKSQQEELLGFLIADKLSQAYTSMYQNGMRRNRLQLRADLSLAVVRLLPTLALGLFVTFVMIGARSYITQNESLVFTSAFGAVLSLLLAIVFFSIGMRHGDHDKRGEEYSVD